MRKTALLLSGTCFLLFALFCTYESLAYYRFTVSVHKALERCSARTAVVLAHTEYDPATLDRALRSISEAITYVDDIVSDVHVHADGTVHFSDESAFRYLKLCGDTLRSEKSFAEAAQGYLLQLRAAPEPHGGRRSRPEAALELRGDNYSELVRQHGQLRELLTELANEKMSMEQQRGGQEQLVDIGAIEHALREINFFYGVAR